MPGPIVKKSDAFHTGNGLIDKLMDYVTDDPFGGLSPAPLISIYKDLAGVPSKALREKGTMAFLQSALDRANTAFRNPDVVPWQAEHSTDLPLMRSAEEFAAKYPRVAAHMRINPQTGDGVSNISGRYAANIQTPTGRVGKPMTVTYSESGLKDAVNPDRARDIIAHEGTHAAQALGNHNFAELYHSANKIAGYHDNPFEQMARNAGENFATGIRSPIEQNTFNPVIKDFLNKVVKDRGVLDQKDTVSLPQMLDVGFNSKSAMRTTVNNILHNLRMTAEDRGLVSSAVERKRFGGSGYVKGRDGHPQYKEFIAPDAPDGQRNATAMRMIEDMTRWGLPPDTAAIAPARTRSTQEAMDTIEKILKYRKGLPY